MSAEMRTGLADTLSADRLDMAHAPYLLKDDCSLHLYPRSRARSIAPATKLVLAISWLSALKAYDSGLYDVGQSCDVRQRGFSLEICRLGESRFHLYCSVSGDPWNKP